MAARVRDHLGPEGVEIAFDASAFAVTSPRGRQRLQTVMSAMSILAMAMVIYLFGGYVDLPNERRISAALRTLCATFGRMSEVPKRRTSL